MTSFSYAEVSADKFRFCSNFSEDKQDSKTMHDVCYSDLCPCEKFEMMKHYYPTMLIFSLVAGGLTAKGNSALETALQAPPELLTALPNMEAAEDTETRILNLTDHFHVPGDPEAALVFELVNNAAPAVASITINNQKMTVDFLSPGQTSVIISAAHNGLATTDTFVVGVRPVIMGIFEIATFDDLELEPESYWNGSDESGSFTSGPATFINDYNSEWFAWRGWGYSNTTDNTTPGYGNQYSAFSPVRLDSSAGTNYGVTYISPYSQINFPGDSGRMVEGFFITNSTYAALSMQQGDDYTKKFGGEDGTDPDWLKLTITGYDTDSIPGTAEFYLADYTFEDNDSDYMVETWQWVNLSDLGRIKHLTFSLASTDNGDYGMNTPAFFCMDNLFVVSDITASVPGRHSDVKIYPNPTTGIFSISTGTQTGSHILVYDMHGKEVRQIDDYHSNGTINIDGLAAGIYILKIETEDQIHRKMIIKK